MKIDNVRFWFACNSSSVHSVVRYPTDSEITDDLCGGADYFGWEPFVAASNRTKRSYLKTLLYGRMLHLRETLETATETARLVADQVFPDTPTGHIDHQSVPLIPRKYGSHEPCYEFLREMTDYILQDGVVIHGGNDNNDGEDDPAYPKESNVDWYKNIPLDQTGANWVCRKEGDWWVLFNRMSGTKVTLSFKDDAAPRTRASVPELVDLKITDFCPYGCAWCYQGSTHQGRHAEGTREWLNLLAVAQVFEVAIGGGEPTLHPEFKNLLRTAPSGLSLNFSTRNLDWVCYNADLIREKCGGFAVSISGNYAETERVIKALDKANLLEKATLQYVMSTASDWDFEETVKTCHDSRVRLTLLGYKTTGRGKAATNRFETATQDRDGWVEVISDHSYYMAIDTALAARTPEDVFDETFLRRTEGTHSMYIDAVASKASISSYSDADMVSVEPSMESLIKVFNGFGEAETLWRHLKE